MRFPAHGKVLFSATVARDHIAKFHIPYLKWFKERGWETWVAAKNDYPDGVCRIPHCDHFVDIDFARSPFSSQTIIAYRQMRKLFEHERFDVVHTHTPVASVLTRLAARDARREGTKVLYTAHGFHFYDGAPVGNWLMWYPVERAMSRFCDVLIAINREDFARANRFAHCRVERIPGVGVDLSRFRPRSAEDRSAKRVELGLAEGDFALLSVGDLIPRKNQAIAVDALAYLSPCTQLLVCGEGPLRNELIARARRLGVYDRVHLLGFRDDVESIMQACDVLVFPSVHEGLPVAVMEAMASGLPVVASDIRGICPDLIKPGWNGIATKHPDARRIASLVCRLQSEPDFAHMLAERAVQDAECCSIERLLRRYEELYESLH